MHLIVLEVLQSVIESNDIAIYRVEPCWGLVSTIQAQLWVDNKVLPMCWDESKPELVDSWLGFKRESGPKWSHDHIRVEPVLAPICPKSHWGDGGETLSKKHFEQSRSWFPSWRWVGVVVREGVSLSLRKQELMTKKMMSGVWVASEWNQPDNCWRGAIVKLLEFVLESGIALEWGRRDEMKRCKRLEIHQSSLSFFLHFIHFLILKMCWI